MKIDSCLIVKNEEENIEALINQLLMFSNEVHITDTGSTDNTLDILYELTEKYNNVFLHQFEWCYDFAKARNYSLTCYECNADYQFWCDADDELNDKLIETLKEFSQSDKYNADIYYLRYKCFTGNENAYDYIYRTSLLKVNTNLKWYDPIHEFIGHIELYNVDYNTFDNGSLLIHKKINSINHTDRNLRIFRNMEKTNYVFSARNRFYYGRELYNNDFKEYASYQFCKCIDSDDDNILDKVNACIYLFYINGEIGLQYFYKLFSNESYIRKDLFYIVANYFFNKEKYILAKLYYILCINCEEPINYLLFEYDNTCHIGSLLQLGLIEYNNGNIKKFIYYNNEVLNINADNETAKHNLSLVKDNN